MTTRNKIELLCLNNRVSNLAILCEQSLDKVDSQKRKIERLTDALEDAVDLLVKIRFCEWPTIGLGIGLNVEEMDQVIIKADKQLPQKRKRPLRVS